MNPTSWHMNAYNWILIAAFVVWASFISFYINCKFKQKLSFLKKSEVTHSSKYPAFARDDFKNWNFLEMTLVGIFLMPIRFTIIVFMISFGSAFVILFSYCCCVFDWTKPLPKFFSVTSKFMISSVCRACLFFMGFWWISQRTRIIALCRAFWNELRNRGYDPIDAMKE